MCLAPLPMIASPAWSQTEPPSTAPTAAADGGEIVVTAQRRAERLVDIPLSISVLDAGELTARGIEDVQDLSFAVPGLTMRQDGPGSYTIFLRGLANQSGAGALVSQYLDEVPLSLGGFDQLSPSPLDLQRVEVLKGPQGTLYGAGSAGGTIRYLTAYPDPTRVAGNVEADSYLVQGGAAGTRLSGMLNVPLAETLALRVAGAYEKGGGWIDQPEAGIRNGNGTELLNLRAKLRWTPDDRFSLDGLVQIHRADTRLGLGFEEPNRTVDVGIDRSLVLIPKKFDFDIYNLEANYDFGDVQLMSSTSFIEHRHQYPFTYIPRPGNFSFNIVEGNDDRYVVARQFSQEVRLSDASGPFKWTLGAFYANGRRQFVADYEYLFAANADLSSGGGVLIDDLYYGARSTTRNYSVFADLTWDISRRVSVGGGIRYFNDRQTSLIEFAPGTGETLRATFDSIDPRVFAQFHLNERNNIYASFAKGFRSGGFNAEPFAPYDPEDIFTYELGLKGGTADRTLSYELAGFYTIYDNMVRRRLVNVDGAFLQESSNIGRVRVRGVEAGVQFRPAGGLTLGGNIAYLDSVVTETDAGDPVNEPGDRTDYTPRLSFTLNANYDFAWAANVPGFVRADYSHRDAVTYIDRSSFLPSALPQRSDALDLVNLRVGATVDRVTVELYTLNLLDQNKAIDPYQGWANSNRTRPRVVGVRTGFSF